MVRVGRPAIGAGAGRGRRNWQNWLARQLAAEVAGGGTGVAAGGRGAEGSVLRAAWGVTAGSVLLVVDYAETRSDLAELMRAVLDDPGPGRVLLAARSLGEWWDKLAEQSYAVARLLAGADPLQLDRPVSEAEPDERLAAAAVPYFTPPGSSACRASAS